METYLLNLSQQSDWVERLKVAIHHRADCEKVVRQQMEEETKRLRVTTYGQLPGWPDYQQALDEVVKIENEIVACLGANVATTASRATPNLDG